MLQTLVHKKNKRVKSKVKKLFLYISSLTILSFVTSFPSGFRHKRTRMMLMLMRRKTTKTHQQDQHMKHSKLAGVSVAFNPKNSESDTERSPTSPFDIGIFSSYVFRHPRSESEGRYQKRWKCDKVGLSLIYSLYNDAESNGTGNVVHSSCLKIVPTSLIEPKPAKAEVEVSNVIFEIGEAPSVPDMRPLNLGNDPFGSVPASEIELSEDYTRVTVHGPNPKVTHIFGDNIVGRENSFLNDFLKNCYGCQKNLDGEDIYMYRGEKAFCSNNCRAKEIEMDEEMEKNKKCSSEASDISYNSDEFT